MVILQLMKRCGCARDSATFQCWKALSALAHFPPLHKFLIR